MFGTWNGVYLSIVLQLIFQHSIFHFSGSLNSRSFVVRASESDGASSGGSYGGVDRDSVATFEDISPAVDTESPKVEKESPAGEKESPAVVYEQTSEPEEAVKVDPLLTADEEQTPIFEFLEKLNVRQYLSTFLFAFRINLCLLTYIFFELLCPSLLCLIKPWAL